MLKLILYITMNIWVYSLLITWTVIASVIAFPALVLWRLLTRWSFVKIMRLFVWIYGRGCLLIFRPFTRFQYHEVCRELLPNPGIIVVNHLSFFDTYMLSLLPAFNFNVCLRSWPFRMPWYSFFMRIAEYLDMESSSWEEIVTAAEKVKQEKHYMIIFPEGHRSRTGKLRRFYSGAFKLATELNLPILPLCVTGTHEFQPPGRWWLKPAQIKLKLLPPVYPEAYSGERAHVDMRKDVHRQMVDAIEQMENDSKCR
jgi:1-acyl-sn-glycerol-3-phosphate acyltransferase